MDDQFDPPSHLSPRAAELWRRVVPLRARSPERLAIVTTALEALDRADAASAQVAADGMTAVTKTTGAIHVHPCLKVERESRQLFAKLWTQLGFDKAGDMDAVQWNAYRKTWQYPS